LPVPAGSDSHPAKQPNGGRHYESIVVVGMFADKVHAAGSAKKLRSLAKQFLETAG
jgi:hypothetical protein